LSLNKNRKLVAQLPVFESVGRNALLRVRLTGKSALPVYRFFGSTLVPA
jgi:hypothetical protein